ncbi:MAG: hypothetical protein HZB23_06225 [Deltaproteobacteria bacterium]|nr:hypothetical protein [Deltaproteobacteria bacterium]
MRNKKTGKIVLTLFLAAILASMTAGSAFATEPTPPTDTTYSEVANYINNYDLPGTLTWQDFMAQPWEADQFKQEFGSLYGKYFTHEQLDEFYRILGTDGSEAALAYAETFLRPTSSGMSEPSSAPQRVAEVMLRNVVLPPAVTRLQKKAMLKDRTNTRFVGGDLRYEWVNTGSGRDGEIPGFTAGMAWDQDQFSYGFMIPYDHLDMDGWSAHRFGVIGFGRHNRQVAQDTTASLTGNVHYMYLDVDDFDSVNYYGFGLSAAAVKDLDWVVPGAALTYQLTKDDTDNDDDVQQLVKLALNCGFRVAENAVFNVFLVYNKDMSSDLPAGTDTTFVDLGFEAGYAVTDTFGVNIGYKTVQEADNYESDTIYIGSLYQW